MLDTIHETDPVAVKEETKRIIFELVRAVHRQLQLPWPAVPGSTGAPGQ